MRDTNKMNIVKNWSQEYSGKNNELGEVDDEVFLQIIRSGIEETAKNDKGLYNELFDHAIKNYVDSWLDSAAEDDDEFDIDQERKEAKETFMKYFSSK